MVLTSTVRCGAMNAWWIPKQWNVLLICCERFFSSSEKSLDLQQQEQQSQWKHPFKNHDGRLLFSFSSLLLNFIFMWCVRTQKSPVIELYKKKVEREKNTKRPKIRSARKKNATQNNKLTSHLHFDLFYAPHRPCTRGGERIVWLLFCSLCNIQIFQFVCCVCPTVEQQMSFVFFVCAFFIFSVSICYFGRFLWKKQKTIILHFYGSEVERWCDVRWCVYGTHTKITMMIKKSGMANFLTRLTMMRWFSCFAFFSSFMLSTIQQKLNEFFFATSEEKSRFAWLKNEIYKFFFQLKEFTVSHPPENRLFFLPFFFYYVQIMWKLIFFSRGGHGKIYAAPIDT